MGFDPFKMAAEVAETAAGAAAGAAGVVAEAAAGVANAAVEAVGAAADAIGAAITGDTRDEQDFSRKKFHYMGRVRSDAPKVRHSKIEVKEVTLDALGKPLEGCAQTLDLSSSGVRLLANNSIFAECLEALRVGNCALFQGIEEASGDPLQRAIGGAYTFSLGYGVPGAIIGALAGVKSCFDTHDAWYAQVQTLGGSERVFRLNDKQDGEKLMEYLDTYMKPRSEADLEGLDAELFEVDF